MPTRNRKGQFVKGGHRKHAKRRHASHAARTRTVHHHHTSKRRGGHRRRHGKSGGGVSMKHLAIAGLGLAFLAGPASPIKSITDNVAKIPGAKTFGNPAILGITALAIDRFAYRNKWLRAAGLVGVALAAVQVGTKGKDFAWVGDAPRQLQDADDVADVDDIGDEYDEDEG